MDDKNRRLRYIKALYSIQEKYTVFSSFIFRMGRPIFCDTSTSTAMMREDEIVKGIVYEFNREFFDSLSNEELAFIISHETMHVLLSHLKPPFEVNNTLYNYACDAVINDILSANFSKEIMIAPEDIITGEYLVKFPVDKYTAESVYWMIYKEVFGIMARMPSSDSGDSNKDNDSQDGSSSGEDEQDKEKDENDGKDEGKDKESGSDDKIDKVINKDNIKNIDDHSSWYKFDEDLLEELLDNKTYDFVNHKETQSRGTEAGNWESLVNKRVIQFSLWSLVRRIVGHIEETNYSEIWRKHNPQLSYVYPDVILPYDILDDNINSLNVLFSVDSSGSVSNKLLDEFLSIARYHLRNSKHKVSCITFDVGCRDFDLKNQVQVKGRGGTSFDEMVKHVNKMQDEFDVVFVLTDGYGGSINEHDINPERWFWIISPNGTTVSPTYGKSIKVPNDYLKG